MVRKVCSGKGITHDPKHHYIIYYLVIKLFLVKIQPSGFDNPVSAEETLRMFIFLLFKKPFKLKLKHR